MTAAPAAWVDARWRHLAGQIGAADPELAVWARAQLGTTGVGEALQRRNGWRDTAERPSGGYDQQRDPTAREALGQFFTPGPLASMMASVAGVGDESHWPSSTILDPACGAGSLLLAAAQARRRAGCSTARCLEGLEGWDRDEGAAWSCRATLVEWALGEGGHDLPSLQVYGGVDALSSSGRPGELLARRGDYRDGVGAVLTNPPYLEAKRMRRAEPGLRERLKETFPQLTGAFDLYLAFCWRTLEWVGEGGSVALLVPSKILQGRYAAPFREALATGPFSLAHLVDMARMSPRPFPKTGVYPSILHLARRPVSRVRVHRVTTPEDLALPMARWPTTPALDVGGERPLFVPFDTWPDLAPLFALPRLGEIARVLSTCSFHQKGLRERFVTPEPHGEPAFPYLGGPSRSRRTEVDTFCTRWAGWWIRFDQESLRRDFKNPLPDLHRTFLRPKAIFCQHARRVQVVADLEGRFVTKDVYPVAVPRSSWTVEQLVAVLSSTVFTALYNTIYQGILVGGETYHYLPAFMNTIPVPRALEDVGPLVRRLHEQPDDGAWLRLDRLVARAYGVDEDARQKMVDVHLRRVGAAFPTP